MAINRKTTKYRKCYSCGEMNIPKRIDTILGTWTLSVQPYCDNCLNPKQRDIDDRLIDYWLESLGE